MPPETPLQGGKKTRLWPIISALLLLLMLAIGIPAWILWKYDFFRQRPRTRTHTRSVVPRMLNQEHLPVKLHELHGEGKIYFVPLGKQVVAPESLVRHYASKFHLSIHLLPQLALQPRSLDAKRKQYIAEELIEQVKRAHPDLAKDANAVIIALTDEDIYTLSNDKEFVCTYRTEGHLAVVSTRRMDDAFWGVAAKPELTVRRLQHMVSQDIAILYYNLSESADPQSLLYPVTVPDGSPDDIWESDVHPEDSAYGLSGKQYCLTLTYSYRTQRTALYPRGRDCEIPDWRVTDLEIFRINSSYGGLNVFRTDFNLGGKPEIVFTRVQLPGNRVSGAFGAGGDHFYNTYLLTDNLGVMSEMDLTYPNGGRWHFQRTSPGHGFSPDVTFIGNDEGDFYRAHITWDGQEYIVKQTDGESIAYLPCSKDTRCLENGYQDSEGDSVSYTRNPDRSLAALENREKSLVLSYDGQARITAIHDQSEHKVLYEYDDAGYLSKVTASDGIVTVYEYSDGGRFLKVSVIAKGRPKTTVFTAEIDNAARVIKAIVPGQGAYTFDYDLDGWQVTSVLMTSPQGKKLRIDYEDYDSYEAHSER